MLKKNTNRGTVCCTPQQPPWASTENSEWSVEVLTVRLGNGTQEDNASLERPLRGLSPSAEVVSTFHQDAHTVHGHDAYHQQAEGTHLGTDVGKTGRDKQGELGVSQQRLDLQMITTLLRHLPTTGLVVQR